MNDSKVVHLPSSGRRRLVKSGDDKLAADVRSAWRRLARTIRAAREAGLTVETDFSDSREPKITRKL